MKEELKKYLAKRDFSKTTEPSDSTADGQKNIFVIQEHHASQLHYDFRLEINGVLKSWAIPKEPTSDASIKRLAVPTEDHPILYANFSGSIPEGNYGAGVVKIWDKGKYKNVKDESILDSYNSGRIEINLNGKKLKGTFALIKTKMGWLFFKTKNEK
ncbi:3'-phosphoesterase [bacterium]|nr:3'-phosphoesterase [bacterium]